jgi:hypothetical protein
MRTWRPRTDRAPGDDQVEEAEPPPLALSSRHGQDAEGGLAGVAGLRQTDAAARCRSDRRASWRVPDRSWHRPACRGRSEYLGLVVTRPEADTFVLGLNYFDTVDNGDNEDMYRLDTATFEVTPYMRGSFEKEYPEYVGYHRATKPYLRKPPST